MKSMNTSQKGLYVGTGVGLILFVLVGVLSSSLIGGLVGLKLAGAVFGAPLQAALLARVIVAVSMVGGIIASLVLFVGGIGVLGWAIGYVYDAMAQAGMETKQAHSAK